MFDILIAVSSSAGTALLFWLVSLAMRGARAGKRLDRVERLLPALAKGQMVMLRIHMHEETNGDIRDAMNALEDVLSSASVSQKAKP